MTFPNLMYEFRSVGKRIAKIANVIDQRRLSSVPFDESDDAEAKMALMVETADALWKMGMIKSKVRVLDKFERLRSLTNAIAKIAVPLRGGRVFSEDTFKSAVERACDPADRECWVRESGGLMHTLLTEHPEIGEELRRNHGVLVWDALDVDPTDHYLRIVNTRWLVDEADIFSHVANNPGRGKTCRFCQALEPPESFELQPLDPEQRSHDVLIDGMSGKKMAILQRGTVHCHVPCQPYWLEWVRIADQLEQDTAA